MNSDLIEIRREQEPENLVHLIRAWQGTLTGPQDGMWASFRDQSKHWKIFQSDAIIGYACTNEENQLIQFYVQSQYSLNAPFILRLFIDQQQIATGIVGTNNPIFLSAAVHHVKSVYVHSFLFIKKFDISPPLKQGVLSNCQPTDLERSIEFYHRTIAAPKEWLIGYLGQLIAQQEVFLFELDGDLIGACEVRKNASMPQYSDIGMLVSSSHRQKGYGSYLLHRAATIARDRGTDPICSCEVDNLGSLKSIDKCGFVSFHQLLTVDFRT